MTWTTPYDVVFYIEKKFIRKSFTIDLCADEENSITPKWIDNETDIFSSKAIAKISQKDVCFMNPPYSKGEHSLGDFVSRGKEIHGTRGATVALLIPAQSIGTKYWAEHIGLTPADLKANHATVYFFPYRISFVDQKTGRKAGTPVSPSVVVVYEVEQ